MNFRDPHAEVLHPRDEAELVDAHAVAHDALVRLARLVVSLFAVLLLALFLKLHYKSLVTVCN